MLTKEDLNPYVGDGIHGDASGSNQQTTAATAASAAISTGTYRSAGLPFGRTSRTVKRKHDQIVECSSTSKVNNHQDVLSTRGLKPCNSLDGSYWPHLETRAQSAIQDGRIVISDTVSRQSQSSFSTQLKQIRMSRENLPHPNKLRKRGKERVKQDMTRGVDIDKHIAELHRKKATLGSATLGRQTSSLRVPSIHTHTHTLQNLKPAAQNNTSIVCNLNGITPDEQLNYKSWTGSLFGASSSRETHGSSSQLPPVAPYTNSSMNQQDSNKYTSGFINKVPGTPSILSMMSGSNYEASEAPQGIIDMASLWKAEENIESASVQRETKSPNVTAESTPWRWDTKEYVTRRLHNKESPGASDWPFLTPQSPAREQQQQQPSPYWNFASSSHNISGFEHIERKPRKLGLSRSLPSSPEIRNKEE